MSIEVLQLVISKMIRCCSCPDTILHEQDDQELPLSSHSTEQDDQVLQLHRHSIEQNDQLSSHSNEQDVEMLQEVDSVQTHTHTHMYILKCVGMTNYRTYLYPSSDI